MACPNPLRGPTSLLALSLLAMAASPALAQNGPLPLTPEQTQAAAARYQQYCALCRDTLSTGQIDGVTAFIRSRSSGWTVPEPQRHTPPALDDYIINPDAPAPEFALKDGLYVSAAELDRELKAGKRMVLLDTRVTSMWERAHIEGAVPGPYYASREEVMAHLPTDGTWIVAYCECPRAAAESVVRKLREGGLTHTAVLWEGIQGWVGLGYPVVPGNAAPKVAGQP